MSRQARLDFPGTLHHAMCRGIEKREIVSDDQDRDNFVRRMGQVASETGTAIYAWALMSDHAHILLRSGPQGISKFMRKLLTGYAVSYNRRHRRHGYLFQNRYKSIVCEEDLYLLELVRYIHLNPVRAGVVNTLEELDAYPYCGHRALVCPLDHEWHDRQYVLCLFGDGQSVAVIKYREFVESGLGQGSRPELVGGGLVRSQGGWSQVASMRKQGGPEGSDDRILGSGQFVEKMVAEAEDRQKRQLSGVIDSRVVEKTVRALCDEEGISVMEVRGGSRRRQVSLVRMRIARELIEGCGVPMATVARETGVTTAAISKLMRGLMTS